jgi:hypothetical protein
VIDRADARLRLETLGLDNSLDTVYRGVPGLGQLVRVTSAPKVAAKFLTYAPSPRSGKRSFAARVSNGEVAPKADSPFDRQRCSKIAPICRGAGAPEKVPPAAYVSARCSHGSRSSGNMCLVGRNNSASSNAPTWKSVSVGRPTVSQVSVDPHRAQKPLSVFPGVDSNLAISPLVTVYAVRS